jgi:hypothetical protein
MEFGKSFRAAFLMLKSVDFWLFAVSFMVSGFTLQGLTTVKDQVLVVVAILAVSIVTSFIIKRRNGWTRKPSGIKVALSAVGIMLFVSYAICAFSISSAGIRNMELTGSFLDQAQTALANPMVFGGVIPFIFLGVFSAASYLGLTDAHELEAKIET